MLQLLRFLHKLYGILLRGTFVSSLPLVYLANNLFKSMWAVDIYYVLWVKIHSFCIYFIV